MFAYDEDVQAETLFAVASCYQKIQRIIKLYHCSKHEASVEYHFVILFEIFLPNTLLMTLRQFALNGWGRYAPIVIIITIKIGFHNYTN
jgi:hypothetical protein